MHRRDRGERGTVFGVCPSGAAPHDHNFALCGLRDLGGKSPPARRGGPGSHQWNSRATSLLHAVVVGVGLKLLAM